MDPMLRQALGKTRRLRQQVEDVLLGPDGDEWERELKNFLAKRPCWVKEKIEPKRSDFLRLLSAGRTLIITETDGTETIAEAKDLFTAYIDSDFKNWNLNVPGEAKLATPVEVRELVKDGRFDQFFPTLGKLDDLCLTQAQIIKFCRDHKNWLRTEGWGTFFLFKKDDQFFVACVDVDVSGRLKVDVRRFSDVDVWSAEDGHRVVVPQLVA